MCFPSNSIYNTGFGQGSGLSVFFKGNASNNHITIENCSFDDNSIVYGGGLYLDMQDNSYKNNVVVTDSNIFSHNTAQQSGGVEYFIYFLLPNYGHVLGNSYSFLLENVSFIDNYTLNEIDLYHDMSDFH